MLFIWGWRARTTHIGDGTFFCPSEGGDRPYRLLRARRWFTVLGLPLVGGETLGNLVECQGCGEPHKASVLTQPTTGEMEESLRTALRYAIVGIFDTRDRINNDQRYRALEMMARFGHTGYTLLDLEQDLVRLDPADLESPVAKAAESLSSSGQERVLRACIELAVSDGSATSADLDVIATVGRTMGMTPAHIKGVLDEVESSI